MSLTEAEIRDRLMVAIGATSDIENIHVRRRAAKAAAPEVLAIIQEAAHELAEKIRVIHQPIAGEGGTQWCQVCSQEEVQPQPVGWWVPWPCPTLTAIDPKKES